jgi:hypothetical protein
MVKFSFEKKITSSSPQDSGCGAVKHNKRVDSALRQLTLSKGDFIHRKFQKLVYLSTPEAKENEEYFRHYRQRQ